MGIIAWIVLGLIAGLIARAIYPGPQPGGAIATILLGIVGAVVGGWISHGVGGYTDYNQLSLMNIIWAIIGSMVVLFLWSLALGRRRAV